MLLQDIDTNRKYIQQQINMMFSEWNNIKYVLDVLPFSPFINATLFLWDGYKILSYQNLFKHQRNNDIKNGEIVCFLLLLNNKNTLTIDIKKDFCGELTNDKTDMLRCINVSIDCDYRYYGQLITDFSYYVADKHCKEGDK